MVKAKLYRQKSHRSIHIQTQKKKKKGGKYIYRCYQYSPPQFGVIHCVFRYSTDAGYIKLIVEI